MCGIFAILCGDGELSASRTDLKLITDEVLKSKILRRRGPDEEKSYSVRLNGSGGWNQLFMIYRILNLRRSRVSSSDSQNNSETQHILLWNGEIFDGNNYEGSENPDESDTNLLLRLLSHAHDWESILRILSSSIGPYAFLYYSPKFSKLLFGRDILGRRSLLWTENANGDLIISSAVIDSVDQCKGTLDWREVPATGYFAVDLSRPSTGSNNVVYLWDKTISGKTIHEETMETSSSPHMISHISPVRLLSPLSSLSYRIDRIMTTEAEEHIHKFLEEFRKSVARRVSHQQQVCKNCYSSYEERIIKNDSNSQNPCAHCSVSILFSGGLDSTMIALISDEYVPPRQPIDLLTVAFKADAPDRLTAMTAHQELCTLRPARRWNLILIDIEREELAEERERHIKYLIKPSNTLLDDSIGCAIWFAARGSGRLSDSDEPYTSPARVVLTGMGADEQFAGYSRHRSAYQKGGVGELIREVALDLDRLPSRNLGRDDRIIADWGREARFPFLDERLISFISSLPMEGVKCDLTRPRGEGEKFLLRCAADFCGLHTVASYPKRAIQFGSRIAKLEGHGKGDDICDKIL